MIFKNGAAHFVQPAFLINPPVEIEPLAKRMESDLIAWKDSSNGLRHGIGQRLLRIK